MNFRHTCPKDGAKSCCSGSKNIHTDSFSCQSFRDGAMASPPMVSPLSFFELFPSRETRESLPHRYSMLLTQSFCPSLPIVSYQWRGKFLRERSSRLSLSIYISIYLPFPSSSHREDLEQWNCGQWRDRINAIFVYILPIRKRCFFDFQCSKWVSLWI